MYPTLRAAALLRRLLGPCCIAASTSVLPASAWAEGPPLDALRPLNLHYGSNDVPNALPDGRSVTIWMGHRENGNAHGYDLYVVYVVDAVDTKGVPRTSGTPEIIDLQPSRGVAVDTIRNEPFDGEAEIESLRFLRARVDGHPVLALVRARRQVEKVERLTDPAKVELTTWRLDGPVAAAGRTTYLFLPTREVVTERAYCDATSALHAELGIDFPEGWDAEPGIDGCAHGGPASVVRSAALPRSR